MSKQLIFIDDSGDPGFTKASSAHLVIAAALFMKPKIAESLSRQIAEYRKSLGWRDDYEFKFAKIRKDIIANLLKTVADFDFQIYAVYVDKTSFKNIAPIVDGQKLYNWTIKELLTIMPITEAKIEIDGRSSKQNMQKTATYLRHQINPDSSKKLEIKFEDSVHDNLIQLADLIAGSISRSIDTDKTDCKTYLKITKNKIAEIRCINQR